jgi:branched-chain amino acid transport system ATP-binding protein
LRLRIVLKLRIVLEIDALRAGYGETVVLEDVALSLPARGTLAVLGRNGVGKTTLLASIMGLTTLHAGRMSFGQKRIHDLPVHQRARLGIGYVPQGREIFPSLTIEENLVVAGRPRKEARKHARWTLQRIYDLFPRLAERRAHMGNQISGGEQQMLAIGRALMGNPTLLLMDEPLEGLAPIIVETLLKALERLIAEDSLAMVLVEQSARLALQMTEAAIVLDRGRVAYSGRSSDLLGDPERLAALFVAQ